MRDAVDHRSLVFLSRRDEIRAGAPSQARVRLLWQVCQIPDFRKTLTDAHLHLLATVFRHLGIDYNNTAFPDHRGRPMPILPCGDPIAELV